MRSPPNPLPSLASALLGSLVLLALGSAHAAGQASDTFPHQRHERLFPQCTVCHAGIVTGVPADAFPSPAACRNCHDGEERATVTWRGPRAWVSNLAFSHPRHAQAVDSAGERIACLDCHRPPGEKGSMAVGRPQPTSCLRCHEHAASGHLAAEARCTTCHVPLVETPLPASAIAALPRPPDHSAPEFVLAHAPAGPQAAVARCAVCHARESCQRCHRNASSLPAIMALQPDPRVASLVSSRAPTHPRPTTHASGSWSWKHGLAASNGTESGAWTQTGASSRLSAACANCHVRTDCRSCHRQGDTRAIEALPRDSGAAAASDTRRTSRRVHPAGFLKDHPAEASASSACGSCHARSFCVECHQGQQAKYHPRNFVARHGSDAYGADTQCSACHSTEAFCRSCHLQTGRGARSRTGAVFHSGQSLWLLNHGEAARQGLEACAGCHTQASCAQCHSATGGWGVDPHPAGFDAKRAQQKNAQRCLLCHAELPGG